MSYDYMGPFDFPCLNPKSYLELPSPPKPAGIQISVCASTWKRGKELIITSIESIYKQSFPVENYEVILVDDNTEGAEREDLKEAVSYLLREYPDRYFRAYFTSYTRCWNDAHTLNVAFKRALGWIIMQSQVDLLHAGETLESAWRHHNHNRQLRLCPAQYGAWKLLDTDGPKWPYFPHEFGASWRKDCVHKVKGRNETIIVAPPDVDFQGAMRDTCGLVAMEDPQVRTLHRANTHPILGRRTSGQAGTPKYFDGYPRRIDRTWTEGDWGVLTDKEEGEVVMSEAMRRRN